MSDKRKLNSLKIITRSALCLLAIVLITLAVSCYVRKTKLQTTFAKVQIGDTKQSVVQVLGQPPEIAKCRDPDTNVDKHQRCVETYWYHSFLVRWGYAFNVEGKVVDKISNVSY
jgi:hypothetical protein